ncbi:MAG TPA: alpha-L-rhamnosidase N-terminal domain-containing protein, partial [Arthrobacter sp.]|nr:alpha-L-rhamnosidase N-terminal domain-containing protein [Arthrobacter sp.]
MTSTPWHAAMITPENDFDGAPLLRREFTLDEGHGGVAKATLRATALGIYEASVNGAPVGPDVLGPGWSSYEWRLRYRSYDVTA